MADQPRPPLVLQQPPKTVIGAGAFSTCAGDLSGKRIFVVTARFGAALAKRLGDVTIYDGINAEPTVEMFRDTLKAARAARPDVIVGLGGGSPLDVSKLVAALLNGEQQIEDVFGIGQLGRRATPLVCLPTTAGTGSEVSPNSILLDGEFKKGIISRHLVPDAAYIDPALTLSVPADVTAATGVDALTHCIEAYANKFAHPTVDVYALEGIRRITRSLAAAVADGQNLEARTDVAYGSYYGGLCLGPVNTGAVHALAYPLGGGFRVAHGVSNALLLTYVLAFNLPAAEDRYTAIAAAMGEATAEAGLERLRALSKQINLPMRLRDVGIPKDAIPRLAKSAMTVTRLLERNVRTVTEADAIEIYNQAW
jgi:alcohol dehydrogenase class IV